jgi:hypothetical protein
MRLSRLRKADHRQQGVNAVVDELRRQAQLGATGSVTVELARDTVRIFLFEGGVYTAAAQRFQADVARRLLSSRLIPDHGLAQTPRALVEALDLPVEQLASAHQEVMLATVGAVIDLPDSAITRVSFAAGDTTEAQCTLPVEVEALLAVLDARRDRLQQDLAILDQDSPALQVGLAASDAVQPMDAGIEAAVFLEQVEASLTGSLDYVPLDHVAQRCGFTRAEAIHLAAVLADRGVVEISAMTPSASREDQALLAVPEAIAG